MKSVIIKACLPDSRIERGFVSSDQEIWCINKQPVIPVRWDRWFQLHSWGHMLSRHGIEYICWLSSLDKPVYLFEEQIDKWEGFMSDLELDYSSYPAQFKPYPVEEAIKLGGRAYLTGSFAYLIAFAILEGFEEIEFAGTDLLYSVGPHSPSESWAIPCMEYWLGIAHAKGIRVREPIPNGIFMNPWEDLAETHEGLYGLDPKVGGE